MIAIGLQRDGAAEWAAHGEWILKLVVFVSAIMIGTTFMAYYFTGHNLGLKLLRQFSLGGENNVAAWWSGTLFFVGALSSFSVSFSPLNSTQSRRGWLMLSAILAALSFDEISSLHEFIADGELANLIPIGVVSLIFLATTFHQLIKGGTPSGVVRTIFVAFILLATIPVQEYLQHAIEWSGKVSYGIRASVEEGTEIGAALIFLAAMRENMLGANARWQSREPSVAHKFRRHILIVTLVLLPSTVAASFLLPHPGGPADWLAAALFMLCVLSAASDIRLGGRQNVQPLFILIFVYLVASVLTNAAKLIYVPTIADLPVSVRGICFTIILIGVIPFMRSAGRNPPVIWLTLCAVAVLVAAFRPEVQWLWRSVPPAVALLVFYLETKPRTEMTVRRPARRPDVHMSFWQNQGIR